MHNMVEDKLGTTLIMTNTEVKSEVKSIRHLITVYTFIPLEGAHFYTLGLQLK